MKKLLASTLAATMFAAMAPAAQAASLSSGFNVTINLTPSCTITTAPGPLTVTYISNDVATSAAGTTFGVKCTSTLPITFSMNGIAGAGVYQKTDPTTGLNYDVTLNAGIADVVTTGNGATEVTASINATVGANQWGTCGTGLGCTSGALAQTVYINY